MSTTEPEVISITGRWGVGKTYAWNRFVNQARVRRSMMLPRYAYVSLFGVASLEDLKSSLFEELVTSSQAGLEPSLQTLETNREVALKSFGKKFLRHLQQLPFFKQKFGDLGSSAFFLTVNSAVICFDDIERRGKNIEIRDLLGMVSDLKEHRKCKVALILNEEALDESLKDFVAHSEKVVDSKFHFDPNPEESVKIALSQTTELNRMLAAHCIALGISNIRVIKKIERSAGQLEALLNSVDQSVMKQAINSLVLLSWSLYEPALAPNLEYLKRRRGQYFQEQQNTKSRDAAWEAKLDLYGFTNADEFDLALLEGLERGFFDSSLLKVLILKLSNRAVEARRKMDFQEAWRLFHDSFRDDNEEEVVSGICSSFIAALDVLSPMDVDATVKLLKSLGRADRSSQLLKDFMDRPGSDKKSFNLSSYPFNENVTDPEVIRAFHGKFETFVEDRTILDVLCKVAETNGWHEDDLDFLARATVDDYYRVIKQSEGEILRKVIDALLQFDRIGNASAPMRQISMHAKNALSRIAAESNLNAARVRKYGVKIEDTSS